MVDVHGLAETRLHAAAQRYTRNRRTLVEALDQGGGPLSLPQLLQRHPGLPQSSAYRNLAILEEAGVVHRIVRSDGFARFELAEDLTEHHHHHRVCASCGRVEDFTLPDAIEASLEHALRRVASRSKFRAMSHQLDLIGLCDACPRKTSSQSGSPRGPPIVVR